MSNNDSEFLNDFGSDSEIERPGHDSNSDSDTDEEGQIIKGLHKMSNKINRHHEMHGGKLNILKKLVDVVKDTKASYIKHPRKTALQQMIENHREREQKDITKAMKHVANDINQEVAIRKETLRRLKVGGSVGSGDLVHIDVNSHNASGSSSYKMGEGFKPVVKGSQEAKDKMAILRALKKTFN